jgi:hypothetical protein
MGNGERRKEEGPFEEQTTFYDVEWALHVVALALACSSRVSELYLLMAQPETLDQVKFPSIYVLIHLPYP